MVRNELHGSMHRSTGSTRDRQPVRTCVGCKERAPAADLLRVVVRPSGIDEDPGGSFVVPDPNHRLPGRGAWLHFDPRCLELAERRRAFGRALRVPGAVDATAVVAFVEGAAADRRPPGGVTPARVASTRVTPAEVIPVEKNRQQH